jgi:teichuronic acid biosynthesis glycosyltransferase TuaH
MTQQSDPTLADPTLANPSLANRRLPNRSLPSRSLVVIVGNSPFTGVPLLGKWLAETLSKDQPVLYVDPPISHMTARRYPELADSLKAPRLRKVRDDLWRLTPLVLPYKDRRYMVGVTSRLMGGQIGRAVKAIGLAVAASFVIAPHRDVFRYIDGGLKVYVGADDYPAGADLLALDRGRIDAIEQDLVRQADFVVVNSPASRERWEAQGVDAIFVPHGVDVEAFDGVQEAEPPDGWSIEGPVATLMGHLNARIDLDLLRAVASRDINVLIIGPTRFRDSRLDELLRHPRIHWVGFKPFSELPRYLSVSDVGLVPYGQSAFNRASFPLKTLEYLAAGLPVVSTDLPSIRWLNSPDVVVASDSDSFAQAVSDAIADARRPDLIARRKAFAGEHTWRARAAQLRQAIGLPVDC